jgi:hypothetical protein
VSAGPAHATGDRDGSAPRPEQLVGVWRLVSFRDVATDGRTTEGPLGTEPDGLLIYTADGHVSVHMAHTGSEPRPVGATAYMGYAGTWHLDGARAVHKIAVTPKTVWAGTAQSRDVELDGDRLTLYGTDTAGPVEQRRVLVWQRVSTS